VDQTKNTTAPPEQKPDNITRLLRRLAAEKNTALNAPKAAD